MEPTQFFNSLRSKGMQVLEDIEVHISSNSNCHHLPLRDLVFDRSLHGTTPLLLACHYGDLGWVKRILEEWSVDVNAAGVYFFNPLSRDDPKIARATPLFVAAFNGHISIVKYLVRKGADVASKTSCEDFGSHYDGMTPLYGALNQRCVPCVSNDRMDVNNMVRFLLEFGADLNDVPSHKPPIWMSKMCGVDETTALIDHGLNLEQLGSLLHHWVNAQPHWFDPNRKNDSIAVIKLLVDKGANFMAKDNNGFTLILAAVKNKNWNCVDYFLEKEGWDKMEKIEAAEMAAAIILSKLYNHSEFKRAFQYWRLALRLRQTEPERLQKTPLVLKSGHAGEWLTSDELEEVIDHPEEYEYQSFLVRLRICSNKTWRAVLELHEDSFTNCITDLKNQGRLVDLLDVLWATLETIKLFDFEQNYDLRSMIDNVVENLIMMLSQLKMNDPLLNAKTFKLPLEVMAAANNFAFSDDDSHSSDSDSSDYINALNDADHPNYHHIRSVLKIFAFIARLPHKILTHVIRQSLRQLVLKNSLSATGRTFLHMACEYCITEDLSTIRLLLLSRANPNAADEYGNAPLHFLARLHGKDAVAQSAAHLLLEYGAQVERANNNGETAADVWTRLHDLEARWNDPPKWCLNPVTVPTLKTFSARVVRAQNLPTRELPVNLILFVEMPELEG